MAKFIGCDSSYDDSKLVIFGAPFDGTTSYRPGARFAPAAMRGESYGIETYSPYQNMDLLDLKIYDDGDLDLPFGNSARVVEMVRDKVSGILADDKLPIMLGGEHLVSLGAIQAAHEKYSDLQIVHFDAHADLRGDYLGETLSHATVMRRAWEIVGDGRIHQYGIRSGDRDEFSFAGQHTIMQRFGITDIFKLQTKAPVYLTIDLDVLDPSCFPGTGTPEAGGISFGRLLEAIFYASGFNIVGMDLVELAPTLDNSGISTSLACKLLREVLLAISN